MNYREKAEELLKLFLPDAYPFSAGSGYLSGDFDEEAQKKHAKEIAVKCVNEIIKSLKITTGHCDLRKLDEQEVELDFNFWDKVLKEIELL